MTARQWVATWVAALAFCIGLWALLVVVLTGWS
jgi:hypothetical protein